MRVAIEIRSRLTGGEYPAASHKAVAIMVDLKNWRGQFMSIPLAPGERRQVGIFTAGPSASTILFDDRKPQHRTPGMLPCESRQLRCDILVRHKRETFGAGGLLVVVDKQFQRLGHTGRTQAPAG